MYKQGGLNEPPYNQAPQIFTCPGFGIMPTIRWVSLPTMKVMPWPVPMPMPMLMPVNSGNVKCISWPLILITLMLL